MDRDKAFNMIAGIIMAERHLDTATKTELLKWLRLVEEQVAERGE